MGTGSGVSRGNRNRNARLVRLRELVPVTNAIVGIDLADKKQVVVVTDHDSEVLARRTCRCRAWDLGAALDRAGMQAAAQGWAEVTVACEPTGHRWRVLGQLAAKRSMPFVLSMVEQIVADASAPASTARRGASHLNDRRRQEEKCASPHNANLEEHE